MRLNTVTASTLSLILIVYIIAIVALAPNIPGIVTLPKIDNPIVMLLLLGAGLLASLTIIYKVYV